MTLALLGGAAACAAFKPPPPPPPNPNDPVVVWEADVAVNGARAIYARNDDTKPHTITWLALYACQNVQQKCGESNPNIVVEPGKTVTVITMTAAQQHGTMRYKFELRYQ